MLKNGMNVLIDGQWGSTGKGKVAGYIGANNHIDIAVSDFQANAGHTTMFDDGKKFVVKVVPSVAGVNNKVICCINPAATFNTSRLLEEIEMFNLNENRLKIHPNAMIITDEHRKIEAERMHKISSTCQGVGAALADKVMRTPKPKTAIDEPRLAKFITDTTLLTNSILRLGGTVLAETAQGLDLSLNHGKSFPYVTSRDITVGSALNNCGVHPYWLKETIGVLRTYPIRVGNAYDSDGKEIGTSGGYYSDQRELSWRDITHMAGFDHYVEERTTVTNKVRRIFTFSLTQLAKFYTICRPTQLAITFIDYLDAGLSGSKDALLIPEHKHVKAFLNQLKLEAIKTEVDCKITYLGTGPKMSECIVNTGGF